MSNWVNGVGLGAVLLWCSFVGICIAGWLQHLYTCFTTEAWGFLIAGAIFAPVGVIHGIGIWLGLW